MPWRIYADDSMWVPPLRLERRFHFSRFNPFFKHGEWQAWIAYRNNLPVGRISAQIDTLHQERYGTDKGHFGLFECIDDSAVCAALMLHAEAWLASRQIRGTRLSSCQGSIGLLGQCRFYPTACHADAD